MGWQEAIWVGKRSDRSVRFQVLPKQWVVDRTFGWLGDYHRLSKNNEFHRAASELMIGVAVTHLMPKRLASARPTRRVDFNSRGTLANLGGGWKLTSVSPWPTPVRDWSRFEWY